MCAAGEEEDSGTGVVKLAPVVTLHGFNIGTELCSHIREEVSESVIRVRLETLGKHLQIMRVIIKNNQIILVTRDTSDGRGL